MKVGILTVIIIILLVIIMMDKRGRHCHRFDHMYPGDPSIENCVDGSCKVSCTKNCDVTCNKTKGAKTPEKEAFEENTEYFGNCTMDVTGHANVCSDDGYKYAFNDFGAPGADFKDWVASQAVDLQVIKNHAEYVSDRDATTTQNITGRTFSPDAHDSYDPIPWVGLRRPQAVPTCNPTQVPDVDYNLYEKDAKFTWKSS